MSHIVGFGVNNFRVFKNRTVFKFAPITIITGTNNSGKSSLIKALCLLKENLNEKSSFNLLKNTTESNLGQFDSLLNNKNKGLSFYFNIPWSTALTPNGNDWLLELTFLKDDKSKENVGKLRRIRFFESTTNINLFDLDIIGQRIETPESNNYEIGMPVYTFIQALNASSIVDHIDMLINKYPVKIGDKFDFNECVFYSLEKPKDVKGIWMSKEMKASFAEITTGFLINDNKPLIFPEMIGNKEISDMALQVLHSFKSSRFRFSSYDCHQTLLLEYKVDVDIVSIKGELCDIESKALKNISSGICSFENDIEFVEMISRNDVFGLFSLNNINKNDDFTPLLKRTYSTYGGFSGKIIPGSLFIFEIFLYEVLYLLSTSRLHEKVMIDFVKYRQRALESTGANNISMYNRNEKRDHFLNKNNLYYLESFFKNISDEIFKYITKALSFNFVSSTRNTGSRIINKSNDTSFSRIINDFILKSPLLEIQKNFLNFWLKEFNIGNELVIENIEGIANVVYIIRGDRKINLTDFGVGTNRILPLLMKIICASNPFDLLEEDKSRGTESNPQTFIIEEPESNLHPALQSKFADLLIDAAYKFNIQFILETHSEYLIRKLQYWTAEGIIKPEDTVIYYLNNPSSLEKDQEQVNKINILDDGSLSGEFGTGFFDEAINLKLDLLKLKNANKN